MHGEQWTSSLTPITPGRILSAGEDFLGTVLMMWVTPGTVTACSELNMIPEWWWSENVGVRDKLANLVEMVDLIVAILVEK